MELQLQPAHLFPMTLSQFNQFADGRTFDPDKAMSIRECPIALALQHYVPGDWYVGDHATLKVKSNAEGNKVHELPRWAHDISMGHVIP